MRLVANGVAKHHARCSSPGRLIRKVDNVIQLVRNVLIGTGLGVAAILVVAMLDGAFRYTLPSLINARVGSTDVGTYVGMAELVLVFLAAGYLTKRWVKGRAALLWVILPIAIVYVAVVAKAPELYTCDYGRLLWVCAFIHSPFIVSIVASCIGYVASGRRSSSALAC